LSSGEILGAFLIAQEIIKIPLSAGDEKNNCTAERAESAEILSSKTPWRLFGLPGSAGNGAVSSLAPWALSLCHGSLGVLCDLGG